MKTSCGSKEKVSIQLQSLCDIKGKHLQTETIRQKSRSKLNLRELLLIGWASSRKMSIDGRPYVLVLVDTLCNNYAS